MMVEAWSDTGWAVLERAEPTLLVLGRPTCDDCRAWHDELATYASTVNGFRAIELDLRSPEGEAFKATQPWTAHIDWVPFNVLYFAGQPVEEWTGGGLKRLDEALRDRS